MRYESSRLAWLVITVSALYSLSLESSPREWLTTGRLIRKELKSAGLNERAWRNYMPDSYKRALNARTELRMLNMGPHRWVSTGYIPHGNVNFQRGLSGIGGYMRRTGMGLEGLEEWRTLMSAVSMPDRSTVTTFMGGITGESELLRLNLLYADPVYVRGRVVYADTLVGRSPLRERVLAPGWKMTDVSHIGINAHPDFVAVAAGRNLRPGSRGAKFLEEFKAMEALEINQTLGDDYPAFFKTWTEGDLSYDPMSEWPIKAYFNAKREAFWESWK